jgi:NAD(P)-dependent dehydrogenase (short-subunit alcohol dehydrogenase family)
VKKIFPYIDILLNNAGLATDQANLSELGYEFTMTVNHFGHFYLTYLLFDSILKSKEARIINVSSTVHYDATDDIFSHLELKQ